MGFMRRLRLSRSDAEGSAAAEEMGLDAFGTETMAAPAPAETAGMSQQSRIAIVVLASLVLIEAVPTALWIRGRLPSADGGRAGDGGGVAGCRCHSTGVVRAGGRLRRPARRLRPATAATTGLAARTSPAAGAKPEAAGPPVAPVERGALAGSVAVTAPVPMQVLLRGRVVATTEAESFMLPVGTQELEFVNQSVGYRTRRTVNVQAGRTATVRLDAPNGTLHINAVPWAEVWMDGQRIGETPIGNLQTAIGSRELVFRHPDLGERRTTVMVTLKERCSDQHGPEEEMRTLFIVFVFLSTPWLAAAAAGQTDLTEARTQYEEAAYEDALTTLTKASASTPADRVQLEQYRALCLIALGRLVEAERAVASMVDADPTYVPPSTVASPRVLSMVADIRRKELPGVSRRILDSGRASFEAKNTAQAQRQFDLLLKLLDDPAMEGRPEREDLRALAKGYSTLLVAAPPPVRPPPPVCHRQAGGVAHAGPRQFRVHARGRDSGDAAGVDAAQSGDRAQ